MLPCETDLTKTPPKHKKKFEKFCQSTVFPALSISLTDKELPDDKFYALSKNLQKELLFMTLKQMKISSTLISPLSIKIGFSKMGTQSNLEKLNEHGEIVVDRVEEIRL